MKIRNTIKQLQVILLSFILVTQPVIGSVTSGINSNNYESNQAELIDFIKQEQERYNALIDQQELLLSLDFDTDKIIDFVTKKITYQAYDGILRGAKGTLIGRAGNSHDQSITLAGMLKDAGLEAQILVAELTDEQANELNQTIATPELESLKNNMASSSSKVIQNLNTQIESLIKSNSESVTNSDKNIDEIAAKLFKQIPTNQVTKGKEKLLKELQKSAKPYRWVRYRMSPTDAWKQAHPAYKEAAKWNLTPVSKDKGSIDTKDLQNFSVEVWIENSKGEKHSVSGLWKKPTANLLEHTLSIEFGSNAMVKPGISSNPIEMFKQSDYYYIQIDGALPKQGKVFDLNGNIYSGDAIAGLNTIFSTINNKSQKAVDALSGLGMSKKEVEKEKKQLTKVWLEFVLEKPNSEKKSIQRVLFDGKALDNQQQTAMKLLQRWDIDIATTTPMQQYYQYEKSNQAIEAIQGATKLNNYIQKNPNATNQDLLEKYGLAMGNQNIGLLTHKRSIFDHLSAKEKKVSYLSEANILAVRHGFSYKKNRLKVYEMTDIISNQRWSFDKQNTKQVVPDIQETIRHGVWQTKMESARIVESQNTDYSDSAYSRLTKSNNLLAHTTENAKALQIQEPSKSAWWDIDMKTGATIGMADLGYGLGGSEVAEELLLKGIGLGITTAFLIVGTIVCVDSVSGAGSVACCIGLNATIAAAGLLVGFLLGLKIVSTLALTTIGVGADLGATFIPTDKICE